MSIMICKGRGICMSRKIKVLLALISLSFTLCVMSNTYSRYVADTTGNLEVLLAKWQILVNESDINNNASTAITLTPVIEQNQYVADDKIAPTSKGYFDIDIDPTDVEVSFDYEISLTLDNTNIPDLMITKYSIIDSTYLEGDELQINSLEDNKINGSLNYDKSIDNYKFEPFTIRIYFEWYEGNDEAMNDEQDTRVSSQPSSTSFKMTANMNFTQKIA